MAIGEGNTLYQILTLTNISLGAALVGLGIYTYRKYSTAGSFSFSGYAVFLGGYFMYANINYFIRSLFNITSQSALRDATFPTIYNIVQLLGTPFLLILGIYPVLWAVFVMTYTAQLDQRQIRALKISVGVYLLLTLIAGLPNQLKIFTDIQISTAVWQSFVEIWVLLTGLLYLGILVGGAAKLYATSIRYELLSSKLVATLTLPVLLPVVYQFVFSLLLAQSWDIAVRLTVVVLSVSLASLWLSVRRYGLFDKLPAAFTVGRNTAVDTFETAFLVVDPESRVTDLNPAAESLFDVSARGVIGSQLGSILPSSVESAELLSPGKTTFELPETTQIIEAKTTQTTDDRGRDLGVTISLYDITEERRRQQRIQVLNRVLRHNIRNDVGLVKGYATLIADGGVDATEYATEIEHQADDLVELGNKAQEIESVLTADPTRDTSVQLRSIIEEPVEDITENPGEVSITLNVSPEPAIRVNPAVLQPVVRELIDNAIRHNDSAPPEVNIMIRESEATLTITDNGPGIPEQERIVIETGEETPLEHGSGLGLWLVKWGVDHFGGAVTIDTDPSGTSVRIRFPDSLFITGE